MGLFVRYSQKENVNIHEALILMQFTQLNGG